MYRFLMPYMEEPDDKGGDPIEQPVEQPIEQEKRTVPEATFLEEKKKRKELERQIRDLREKDVDREVSITKTELKQKYLTKGFDEETAEALADDIASVRAEVKKANFKEPDIDDDLKELAREDFFSDAPTYKNEIQAVVKEYKAKGIDIDLEDAYFKARGKSRLKEFKTDIEQKALLDRRNADDKKIPNSTPVSPKDPYPLDETDKKALEGLQKAQPNGGWNAEKYYKLMKG